MVSYRYHEQVLLVMREDMSWLKKSCPVRLCIFNYGLTGIRYVPSWVDLNIDY